MKTHRRRSILWIVAAIVVLFGMGVYVWHYRRKQPVQAQRPKALASAVDKVSDNTSRLCSPYANMCFTYPANWTSKKTNDAISTLISSYKPLNGVELSVPADGTSVFFTKAGANTNTICSQASICSLHITTLNRLDNGLYVLAASIESMEPTAGADTYTPFVTVLSSASLKTARVVPDSSEAGKTVTITSFNPDFRIKNGGLVKLLALPGTSYGPTAAAAWLNGTEAQSMVTALSSVTPKT